MSWTRGRPNRANQPPFIEESPDAPASPAPASSNYTHQSPMRSGNYRNTQQPYSRNQPREVAASFTQEGLSALAGIFSTAVESALSRTLPGMLEEVLTKVLGQRETTSLSDHELDALSALVAERLRSTGDMAAREVAQELMASPPETEQPHERESEVSAEPETFEENNEFYDRESDLERVLRHFKELGRPVKTEELRELMRDVRWGSNVSVKMSNLIQKSSGQIERVRKGVYTYRPTPSR